MNDAEERAVAQHDPAGQETPAPDPEPDGDEDEGEKDGKAAPKKGGRSSLS